MVAEALPRSLLFVFSHILFDLLVSRLFLFRGDLGSFCGNAAFHQQHDDGSVEIAWLVSCNSGKANERLDIINFVGM